MLTTGLPGKAQNASIFIKKKKKRLKILYKCMLDDLESRTIKVHVFLYSSKQVILNESNEPFQKQ